MIAKGILSLGSSLRLFERIDLNYCLSYRYQIWQQYSGIPYDFGVQFKFHMPLPVEINNYRLLIKVFNVYSSAWLYT